MLSALIHTNKEPEPVPPDETGKDTSARQLKLERAFQSSPTKQSKRLKSVSSATLIVAPASLLSQWSEELERSSVQGSLRVTIWHGQNRLDPDALQVNGENEKGIPVVITSYGTLASEHSKFQKANNQSSIFQGQPSERII